MLEPYPNLTPNTPGAFNSPGPDIVIGDHHAKYAWHILKYSLNIIWNQQLDIVGDISPISPVDSVDNPIPLILNTPLESMV